MPVGTRRSADRGALVLPLSVDPTPTPSQAVDERALTGVETIDADGRPRCDPSRPRAVDAGPDPLEFADEICRRDARP